MRDREVTKGDRTGTHAQGFKLKQNQDSTDWILKSSELLQDSFLGDFSYGTIATKRFTMYEYTSLFYTRYARRLRHLW